MVETLESRAKALLADGPKPLAVLAGRLGTDQATMAITLRRAVTCGEVERYFLQERMKTRRASWKEGTEMYRLRRPET
jgi:DNA-binding MarR family transcriptional regulator